MQSGTSTHLAKATGCACPDSKGCSASYAGFGNQIECAAGKLRGYLSDLDVRGSTISGWAPKKRRDSLDPCSVTPGNDATAALYTYTPWVGAYGRQCGRSDVGGSSLVAYVFARYKARYTWGGPVATRNTCYSGTLDRNVPRGTCIQNAGDRQWRQCFDKNFSAPVASKPRSCLKPSYGFCASETLGRAVAPRTCVQSASTREWFQCGANEGWAAAPDVDTRGVGPAGPCSAVFGLSSG